MTSNNQVVNQVVLPTEKIKCDNCHMKTPHTLHGFLFANRRYKCILCGTVKEDGRNA